MDNARARPRPIHHWRDVVNDMDQDPRDVITESYRLLAEAERAEAEHERWRAERAQRFARGETIDQPLRTRTVEPPPEPVGLSATERKRFAKWNARTRSATARPRKRAPPFTRTQIGAFAIVIAAERQRAERLTREAIEHATRALRDEIATLKAEAGIRAELDELREQVTVLRADRARVIDLPAVAPRREGTA